MGAITIELGQRKDGDPCQCCGNTTTLLARLVYSDGDARAVYYAQFASGHPELEMNAVVCVGEWDEGSTPRDRAAFAMRIRTSEGHYQIMIVDAGECPWSDVEFLGRKLSREEALAHPWIKEVFHITDHMVADDPDIKAFFEGAPTE